jgi:hypothetical protein
LTVFCAYNEDANRLGEGAYMLAAPTYIELKDCERSGRPRA